MVRCSFRSLLRPHDSLNRLVHNVVYYNRQHFGVPQAAGPLEVDSEAISKAEGVFIDASLGKVRAAIRERLMRHC